jgi:hypothetical protein
MYLSAESVPLMLDLDQGYTPKRHDSSNIG